MSAPGVVVGLVSMLGLGLLASPVSGGDEPLSAAFERVRGVAASYLPALRARAASPRRTAAGFIPDGCLIESWCLERATDCFLGRLTRPTGLWRAQAQYSVVRKVAALCPGRYGELQRVSLTGPVERVVFSSEVEADEETASRTALGLCRSYRRDWVSAAPACGPR